MTDKDRINQLEYDMTEMRTIMASIPEIEEARFALSGISGSLGSGLGSNTTTLLQYVERVKSGLDFFTNSTIANNQRLEARTLALETAAKELETALSFEDSNAPWSEHGDTAYDRVRAARAKLKALLDPGKATEPCQHEWINLVGTEERICIKCNKTHKIG